MSESYTTTEIEFRDSLTSENEGDFFNENYYEKFETSKYEKESELNKNREVEEILETEEDLEPGKKLVMDRYYGEEDDWQKTHTQEGHKFDGTQLLDRYGNSLTEEIEKADLSPEQIQEHYKMLDFCKQNPDKPYLLPEWIVETEENKDIHITVAFMDKDGNVRYETWTNHTEKIKEIKQEKEDEYLKTINEFEETETEIKIENNEILFTEEIVQEVVAVTVEEKLEEENSFIYNVESKTQIKPEANIKVEEELETETETEAEPEFNLGLDLNFKEKVHSEVLHEAVKNLFTETITEKMEEKKEEKVKKDNLEIPKPLSETKIIKQDAPSKVEFMQEKVMPVGVSEVLKRASLKEIKMPKLETEDKIVADIKLTEKIVNEKEEIKLVSFETKTEQKKTDLVDYVKVENYVAEKGEVLSIATETEIKENNNFFLEKKEVNKEISREINKEISKEVKKEIVQEIKINNQETAEIIIESKNINIQKQEIKQEKEQKIQIKIQAQENKINNEEIIVLPKQETVIEQMVEAKSFVEEQMETVSESELVVLRALGVPLSGRRILNSKESARHFNSATVNSQSLPLEEQKKNKNPDNFNTALNSNGITLRM